MLTPNLFDMASIIGLNPVSSTFCPTLETQHEFAIEHFTYKNFILDNHDTANEDISNQEHISFLAKKFVPLAIQLHEGRNISLIKVILANLYQSLGYASYKLKHLPNNTKSKYFLVLGPFWLLQLWLNSTFEPRLHITQSQALMKETEGRDIEGTRLTLLTPQENLVSSILLKYIKLFLATKFFDATMAPFVDRLVGPSWLRNKFPGSSPSIVTMWNAVWAVFLTPTILTFRIEVGTPGYGFAGYQPNLVPRQFGCSQF